MKAPVNSSITITIQPIPPASVIILQAPSLQIQKIISGSVLEASQPTGWTNEPAISRIINTIRKILQASVLILSLVFMKTPKEISGLEPGQEDLCRYDYATDKFTTFTIKHGLPDNNVYSILEDNKNHLWLGTGKGLSPFDPATNTFTNYDFKDGLQSGVFAAGHRIRPPRFKGKDGILYFGGPGGFNFFDPSQLKSNNNPSPVVITQFKLFDKLVNGANESPEIVLEYNENYFSFEFSSLSFYNPEKNQYAYKLEGVDPDWVYSGSRRYAAYTNINPGHYTFKVKATNSDGVWNEEGVSISIIIIPPWWLTWWAYGIYGILLIVAAVAIHRYQKQRVIRAEREKAQKKELEQAKEIEKAYHELKTTHILNIIQRTDLSYNCI